jgi:hypothetical protein
MNGSSRVWLVSSTVVRDGSYFSISFTYKTKHGMLRLLDSSSTAMHICSVSLSSIRAAVELQQSVPITVLDCKLQLL